MKPHSQVYADPAKHPRYLSNGFQAHPGEPWLAPLKSTFALDAAGVLALEFSGTIPATAVLGQRYEELAFIRATTADGKEVMTFLRIHVDLTPAKPADAAPKP